MSAYISAPNMAIASHNQVHGICFVCGSICAHSGVFIKPREKGSYFPFLEHHDPPKGADLPTTEGRVRACHLCYAFLNQQWESFERTKTPAIKRLYWLKRSDNGPFTGAEMRVQGEYAAQVMGLQYTPGSFGVPSQGYQEYDGNNTSGSLLSPVSTSSSYGLPNHISPQPQTQSQPVCHKPASVSEDSNGALDLSLTPSKQNHKVKGDQHSNMTNSQSARHTNEQKTICYLCKKDHLVGLARYIYCCKNVEGEAFFPFLEKVPCPRGAMPLSPQGLTRVCSGCATTLRRQWKAYHASKTPEDQRTYRINDEPIGLHSRDDGHARRMSDSRTPEYMDFQELCYLCGQVYHKDSMKLLYTKPPDETSKHSMYFPFVASLQRPTNARPMDSEGRVLSCRACYSYLQRQWQTYQSDGVALHNRQFVLRPLTASGKGPEPSPSPSPSKSGPVTPGSISQPLNIQIAASGYLAATTTPGLLAIAPGLPAQVMPATSLQGPAFYPGYPLNVPGFPKPTVHTPDKSTIRVATEKSVQMDQQKALPSAGVVCFVCSFNIRGYRSFILRSYPRKQESLMQQKMDPFFPFLSSRDPAPGAENMSDKGTVEACKYCYYTLVRQWKEYELSTLQGENNRWLRKYNIKTHVCYVCEGKHIRKKVHTISMAHFPFLRELSKPPNSSMVEFTDSVIVCASCERDLVMQFKEFEKQGVGRLVRQYKIPPALQQQQTTGHQLYLQQHQVSPFPHLLLNACFIKLFLLVFI